MTNVRRAWRMWWLTEGLSVAVVLSRNPADAQAPVCVPSTTPCQVFPAPPACPALSDTPCGGGQVGNNTLTHSTVSCSGSFAQNTLTSQTTFGPANICIGVERGEGFFVCPGTVNVNTN